MSRSIFAHSLVEGGEALKQMADLKYALDDNVKQVELISPHEYTLFTSNNFITLSTF